MIKNVDFQKTTEDAFLKYAASVAQERAIPDVRDMLKIGLRQGLYAQYTNKLTHKDKFQKAQKSVAAAMTQSYVHGDVAMYDTFIRMSRPWTAHYPLEEVQGSYGNPSSPDSHAAARYVEMRASELTDYLFTGLKKNAINEWYWNYDDSEQIPSVFPSIGYWNIVNGCSGIAVAMATSVPQFNLKEVNNALIKIIKNPNSTFDEIYCAPDFATGGTITNGNEVKESLKRGGGKSVRMRATLKYYPNENMIQATELPYSVFTNTVINQLAELTQNDPDYGIDKVIDHTKKTADIRIYLSKGTNPQKMMAKLYHDTSLEYWFSINMVLLDKGRFPKVFGWREACDAYIAHIRECKRNIIQFELDKAEARLNVVEGLLIAVANIDEVVAIIRASESPSAAATALIDRFGFNKPQVEAILAMKLSALTRIDGIKLNSEKEELNRFIADHKHLLLSPQDLDQTLIDTLNLVSEKFGDARKTQISNILGEEEEPEVIEEKDIAVLRYDNNIKILEMPLKKTFKPQEIYYTTNLGSLTLITDTGKMYNASLSKLKIGKEYKISEVFEIAGEHPRLLIDTRSFNAYQSITCITKGGLIKKSHTSDYLTRAKKGVAVMKLDEDDIIVAVIMSSDDNDKIAVIGNNDYYNCFYLKDISYTGRVTKGVKAIKLEKNGYVKDAEWVGDKTYTVTGRAVKGVKNG
jgi:topoisomerase-4 subunit A